jgi:hypothetical protein
MEMEGVIGGSWVCLLVLERDSGCRLPDTVALRAYVLGRGWEGAGLDHTVVVPPERLGNKVGQLTGGLRGQPGGPVQKARPGGFPVGAVAPPAVRIHGRRG